MSKSSTSVGEPFLRMEINHNAEQYTDEIENCSGLHNTIISEFCTTTIHMVLGKFQRTASNVTAAHTENPCVAT